MLTSVSVQPNKSLQCQIKTCIIHLKENRNFGSLILSRGSAQTPHFSDFLEDGSMKKV